MTTNWQESIIENFDKASYRYNDVASIQKVFALKLAEHCSKSSVPNGLWIDLGSGTGLLANALENIKSAQPVMRIDGSKNMLIKHPTHTNTKLFDLNSGFPQLIEAPTLIASNFVLHWLNNPEERIKEWFKALAPNGWLAITYPAKGSFPEWHNAAHTANVACTALPFPSHDLLLKTITKENIKINQLTTFTQEASKVTSLLKPLVQVGAHASPFKTLTISQWKRLQEVWPVSKTTSAPKLTWLIHTMLIQK